MMGRWRQLRWRIVSSHLIVVLVGVSILLLATELTMRFTASSLIESRLIALTQARGAAAVEQALADLQTAFQGTVLSSLVVAALASMLAGLITSLLLTREILRPLQAIMLSSQRIASGHYNERVAIPHNNDELAQVATNFNQMAKSLEQIEQRRVAMIGNVSHELRTPLTGIEGYLEGMIDGLFPPDTETFAQMSQEVRRLRRLVDDLQVLSKVEAGQVSLRLEVFDLIPVIERVVSQLSPQAMAQDLALTFIKSLPQLMVRADADRTAQVLLNLVGNAIRYTPEGGQITVSTSVRQHEVEIAVRDTGIGIPAEALPYIFERFYRVDSSRARSSGGSGIGLTISRHLAWAMGGELTVTSDGPEQGTVFTFTLPLA